MDVWNACARAYGAAILISKGRFGEGVGQMTDSLARLDSGGFLLHRAPLRSILAIGLFRSGRAADALEVVETELVRCEASGEGWFLPELMRVRTELATMASAIAPFEAETDLKVALALAREQGSFEWEVRITNTLSIVLAIQEKSPEASQLLDDIGRRAQAPHRSASLDRLRELRDQLAAGSSIKDSAFTTLY